MGKAMAIDKKMAEILKAISTIKGVKATIVDGDILCCVQVSLLRHDQVDSGSMRVNIPNYYTFGQMVWLRVGARMTPEQEVSSDFWNKAGALCFPINSVEKALDIISEIAHIVERTREMPKHAYIID